MADITFEIKPDGTGTIKISTATTTEEALANQLRPAIDSVFSSNQDLNQIATRTETTNTARAKRNFKISISNATTLSTHRLLAELMYQFFKIAGQFNLGIIIVQNAASPYIDNIRDYINSPRLRSTYSNVWSYLESFQIPSTEVHEITHSGGMEPEAMIIGGIMSGQQFQHAFPEVAQYIAQSLTNSSTSSVRSLKGLPTIKYFLISLDRDNNYTELEKVKTALQTWINRVIKQKEDEKEILVQKCSVTLEELGKDSNVEVFLSKNDKGDYSIQVYSANVSSGMEGKLDIDPNTRGSILAISKGTLESLLNNLDPASGAVISKPKLKQ